MTGAVVRITSVIGIGANNAGDDVGIACQHRVNMVIERSECKLIRLRHRQRVVVSIDQTIVGNNDIEDCGITVGRRNNLRWSLDDQGRCRHTGLEDSLKAQVIAIINLRTFNNPLIGDSLIGKEYVLDICLGSRNLDDTILLTVTLCRHIETIVTFRNIAPRHLAIGIGGGGKYSVERVVITQHHTGTFKVRTITIVGIVGIVVSHLNQQIAHRIGHGADGVGHSHIVAIGAVDSEITCVLSQRSLTVETDVHRHLARVARSNIDSHIGVYQRVHPIHIRRHFKGDRTSFVATVVDEQQGNSLGGATVYRSHQLLRLDNQLGSTRLAIVPSIEVEFRAIIGCSHKVDTVVVVTIAHRVAGHAVVQLTLTQSVNGQRAEGDLGTIGQRVVADGDVVDRNIATVVDDDVATQRVAHLDQPSGGCGVGQRHTRNVEFVKYSVVVDFRFAGTYSVVASLRRLRNKDSTVITIGVGGGSHRTAIAKHVDEDLHIVVRNCLVQSVGHSTRNSNAIGGAIDILFHHSGEVDEVGQITSQDSSVGERTGGEHQSGLITLLQLGRIEADGQRTTIQRIEAAVGLDSKGTCIRTHYRHFDIVGQSGTVNCHVTVASGVDFHLTEVEFVVTGSQSRFNSHIEVANSRPFLGTFVVGTQTPEVTAIVAQHKNRNRSVGQTAQHRCFGLRRSRIPKIEIVAGSTLHCRPAKVDRIRSLKIVEYRSNVGEFTQLDGSYTQTKCRQRVAARGCHIEDGIINHRGLEFCGFDIEAVESVSLTAAHGVAQTVDIGRIHRQVELHHTVAAIELRNEVTGIVTSIIIVVVGEVDIAVIADGGVKHYEATKTGVGGEGQTAPSTVFIVAAICSCIEMIGGVGLQLCQLSGRIGDIVKGHRIVGIAVVDYILHIPFTTARIGVPIDGGGVGSTGSQHEA